jgi:hypothetical protein
MIRAIAAAGVLKKRKNVVSYVQEIKSGEE